MSHREACFGNVEVERLSGSVKLAVGSKPLFSVTHPCGELQ